MCNLNGRLIVSLGVKKDEHVGPGHSQGGFEGGGIGPGGQGRLVVTLLQVQVAQIVQTVRINLSRSHRKDKNAGNKNMC